MSILDIRIRKVQDNGSTFRATPETLYLGGVGSAKVDKLRFALPDEWKGCAVTLHVQRLSGALPDPQLLDGEGCVVVDRRWTREKQGIWMLLAVDEAGYIAMTKPGPYTCYETIDLESTTESITQSIYEQFVAEVIKSLKGAQSAAEQAKQSAGKAEEEAGNASDSADAAAKSAQDAEQRRAAAERNAKDAEQSKQKAEECTQKAESIIQRMSDIEGGYFVAGDMNIPADAWKKTDTWALYPYEAAMEDDLASPVLEPQAVVKPESAAAAYDAGMAYLCETGNKVLRFWAARKPAEDIRLRMLLYGIEGVDGASVEALMDDVLGLSVQDGKLHITYEKE